MRDKPGHTGLATVGKTAYDFYVQSDSHCPLQHFNSPELCTLTCRLPCTLQHSALHLSEKVSAIDRTMCYVRTVKKINVIQLVLFLSLLCLRQKGMFLWWETLVLIYKLNQWGIYFTTNRPSFTFYKILKQYTTTKWF